MAAAQTLYDYREQFDWWRELNWREEDLRHMPVHERQSPDQDFLPLPGVSGAEGRPLYVYHDELPPGAWDRLSNYLSSHGRPSGFDRGGMFSGSQKRVTDYERPLESQRTRVPRPPTSR